MSWRAARQRLRLQEQATTIAAQAGRLREQAVVEERLRIARELHDVVAHGVSAMGIQAGAARRVLDRDPEAARTALANVEDASRDAVTQMRRLLGTLREGAGNGTAESRADRTTEAGVGHLPELVSGVRADGLAVRLDVVESQPGAADRLPPTVSSALPIRPARSDASGVPSPRRVRAVGSRLPSPRRGDR